MRNEIPPAVIAQFEKQMAVITRRQAMRLGMTADTIQTRVRRGEWVEIQPRTYRLAGIDLGWRQQLFGAIAATRGRAAAARKTALALLDVLQAPDGDLEVVLECKGIPRLRGVIVHRTVWLPDVDLLTHGEAPHGIRCTTGARALVDLAQSTDRLDLIELLDQAVGARRAGRALLHRRASALARGRPGVESLVALTEPGAQQEFRSWLERYGALVFKMAHLPEAIWNHPVYRGGRLLGVADAYWDAPAIAELDGLAFHGKPSQRRRDNERDRRFLRSKIPTFRYGYSDLVRKPQTVVDELAEALGVTARPLDLAALARYRAKSSL